MSSALSLRIASVLALVHCVLHTFGGVLAAPKHGAEEVAVMETMKTHHFVFMGSTRSYWDFFFGYGLFITIFLLFYALIFWQLAKLPGAGSRAMRPIVAWLLLNFITMAIVSWRYFFIGPAITEFLIAICLGLAFFQAREQGEAP